MSGKRNTAYDWNDNHDYRDKDSGGHKGGRKKGDDKDGKDYGGGHGGHGDGKDHDKDIDIDIHAKLKGQAQLQGQGQFQAQVQKSVNKNDNDNSNYNKNVNINKSESTATATANVNMDGVLPEKDNDGVDIDLSKGVKVENLLVSQKGDIDYNPGNDVSFEDILNKSLDGKGNDTGIVFSQSNSLEDNDYIKDPDVTNMGSGGFKITGNAKGGKASSDDGIDAGGNGGDGGGHPYYYYRKPYHKNEEGAGGDGGAGGTWGSNNKDDGFVEGISSATADGIINAEAFNQTLVQGANVLGNTVDMTVVGGDYTQTMTGEDADGTA
ncbi:hypothetical protein [Nitratireductor sp. XY-223]|uniref:hypothetical protein n=1 Tax=Nitratireductor sp. XY-223 TaxID=2561926 RepID=UPI0010AAAD93|nr:hypothetical protein [Nitratireductor sp. XY-223]